jgi:aldehyde:ferredoxin oxidoreductase
VDEGKGKINVGFQNLMGIMDSLKMCKFPFAATRMEDLLVWINGVTGWDMDGGELMAAGERLFNLKKLFNMACGLTARDDTLPERILREPRGSGGSADTLPDLESQLREYYAEREWSEEGIPLPSKIASLGLEEFLHQTDEESGPLFHERK